MVMMAVVTMMTIMVMMMTIQFGACQCLMIEVKVEAKWLTTITPQTAYAK
jgi:hypothetical protein